MLKLLLLLLAPAFGRKVVVPPLSLAESVPIGTPLDDPAIPDAQAAWLEMIGGAERSLDIAEFYVATVADSEEPVQAADRLEPVLLAIEKAARRGVTVRLLADAKFAETYPAQLDRLARAKNVEVRRYDMKPLTGGVMHAKYFLVDGQQAWLGSQNMDWRSLDHVLEIGVRVAEPAVVEALAATFALDWALAGGEERPTAAALAGRFPVEVPFDGAAVLLTPVMSPEGLLPDPALWDLPRIVGMIDGAQERVRVQLLSYALKDYGGQRWGVLDDALRAAASRGVSVKLIVSDWSKKDGKVEPLQSLAVLPNVEVRFLVVPDAASGFIPFARTVHGKFLVVDGSRAWVGTSNWSRDYFHASRNVGVVVEGRSFAAALDRRFELSWESALSEAVDPCAHFEPRRVK